MSTPSTVSAIEEKTPPRGRHWFASTVRVLAIVLAVVVVGGMGYMATPQFANRVRLKLITVLESATGGRVELQAFHWNVTNLSVEADGLTIHGLEAPQEVPYAHVDRLYLQLRLTAWLHPGVTVRVLDVTHPVLHLIVYADGTTNQPRPKTQSSNTNTIDTLFNLQAGRVSVGDGLLLFDQRALPFAFQGKDMSLLVRYQSLHDSYLANFGIGDLTTAIDVMPTVHSRLEGELTLLHDRASIAGIQWSTMRSKLVLSGQVADFAAPHIAVDLHGKADLRDIGYLTMANELAGGTARIDLHATGSGAADLLAKGRVSVADGYYYDAYFQMHNISLETPFVWTAARIEATDISAHAAGGLLVHGHYRMTNWLNQADALRGKKFPHAQEPTADFGAEVQGASLPQILRASLEPAYSELGFNAAIYGQATGGWAGDPRGVFVTTNVELKPLTGPDGVPTSGTVDATYSGVHDTVTVRTVDLQTANSSLQAEGTLDVRVKNTNSAILADLTTRDLSDFNGVLSMLGVGTKTANPAAALPLQLHGQAAFHGKVQGPLDTPEIDGHLDMTNFSAALPAQPGKPAQNLRLDSLHTDAEIGPTAIKLNSIALARGNTLLHGNVALVQPVAAAAGLPHGAVPLPYTFPNTSTIQAAVQMQNASLEDLETISGQTSVPVTGTLSGNASVTGTLDNLHGSGHMNIAGGTIYGEPYKSVSADIVGDHSDIGVANLVFLQNGGRITGNGGYDLHANTLHADVTGSGFELAHIQKLQSGSRPIGGALAFHFTATGPVASPDVNGNASLNAVMLGNQPLGQMTATVHTQAHVAYLDLTSNLLDSNLQMHGNVALSGDYNSQAALTITNVDAQPLLALYAPQAKGLRTALTGKLQVSGPLKTPRLIDVEAAMTTFQLKYDPYTLANQGPLQVSVKHGVLQIDSFHVTGPDTDLTAQGTANLFGQANADRTLRMKVNGAVNLGIIQSFNKDFVSSGHLDIAMEADGTLEKPDLHGKVGLVKATLADIDFPNGLSDMNGTMEFNQDRLEVRHLQATTGGGTVNVGGFLTWQRGLYADLTANARSVRVRYPAGLSSTADATLHLIGTQQQSSLSGNVQLTRFGLVGGLSLGGGRTTAISLPADPNSLSSHVLLDVHLTSAPELNFENSYATLAGQVDLHIRGSVATPSVLGRVVITQGSANLAGTQYQLQRGQVYFSNPVRIDPIIDLDATATVSDYNISLGVHGTLEKLNTTYRSEPPLPQADIIALLALGRTQEQAQIYQQQQTDAGVDPTTNALLGGALNATVSNRVQKLFGVGQVKIDPNFVGTLGQSSARVTVTQQVTKAVTLTYATNVNETSQQLIQAQIAITRDISLVAVRDEAGVFSVLIHVRQHRR